MSTLCGGERSWFFVPTMLVLQIETLASLRLHSLVSFVFETGFYSVPQASLELTRVLLPQSPELLEYRPGSLGLVTSWGLERGLGQNWAKGLVEVKNEEEVKKGVWAKVGEEYGD